MGKRIETIYEKLSGVPAIDEFDISEDKDITVYIRFLGNENRYKDILNDIPNLDYQYQNFGLFKIWFPARNSTKIINNLLQKLLPTKGDNYENI